MTDQPPTAPPTPVMTAEQVRLSEQTAGAIVDRELTSEEKETLDKAVRTKHENDPYFFGTWSGVPNYKCPHCPHKSLGGPAAIEEHIYDYHPDEAGIDFGETHEDEDDVNG